MHIEASTTVRTETQKRLTLDAGQIRLLLQHAGVTLPTDVSITVHVPGGADWSNTELDIDSDCPVVISWTELEVVVK